MSDEQPTNDQTIEPCPYCGVVPYPDPYDPVMYSHRQMGSGCCRFEGVLFLPPDWNALCADIERGRRYDAMHQKFINANDEACILVGQRDEAVRLLDWWRKKTGFEAQKDYLLEHMNELTIKANSSVAQAINAFLDDPAIAAIVDKHGRDHRHRH